MSADKGGTPDLWDEFDDFSMDEHDVDSLATLDVQSLSTVKQSNSVTSFVDLTDSIDEDEEGNEDFLWEDDDDEQEKETREEQEKRQKHDLGNPFIADSEDQKQIEILMQKQRGLTTKCGKITDFFSSSRVQKALVESIEYCLETQACQPPKHGAKNRLAEFYVVDKKFYPAQIIERLRIALTIQTPEYNQKTGKTERTDDDVLSIFHENENWILVPRFYGQSHFGRANHIPQHWKTVEDEYDTRGLFSERKGDFRDHIQRRAFERYMESIDDNHGGGGVLALPCNWGKTFVALWIASHILEKTGGVLVWITNTEDLANQVVDDIHDMFPYLVNKVSIIGGSKKPKWDAPCLIVLVQKLNLNPPPPEICKRVMMLIVDECHHGSAPSFLSAIVRFSPKYTLGLSATPTRRDGLSTVMHAFLGPILFAHFPRACRVPTMTIFLHPRQKQYQQQQQKAFFDIPTPVRRIKGSKDRPPVDWNQFHRAFALDADHTLAILDVVIRHAIAHPNEQAVIFCMFVWQTNIIAEILKHVFSSNNNNEIKVVAYNRKVKKSERKQLLRDTHVIVATKQMLSEGTNIKRLTLAAFNAPCRERKQMAGRIGRYKEIVDHAVVVEVSCGNEICRGLETAYRKDYENIHYLCKTVAYTSDGVVPYTMDHDKLMPLGSEWYKKLTACFFDTYYKAFKEEQKKKAEDNQKKRQNAVIRMAKKRAASLVVEENVVDDKKKRKKA